MKLNNSTEIFEIERNDNDNLQTADQTTIKHLKRFYKEVVNTIPLLNKTFNYGKHFASPFALEWMGMYSVHSPLL